MKHVNLKKSGLLAAWILANVLFFGLVGPLESSSLLVFVGFGLLAVDIYLILISIISVLAKIRGKNWRRPRVFAAVWTFVSIVLLSLQSIGQLSLRDGVAVTVVAIIFLVYSSYYRVKR